MLMWPRYNNLSMVHKKIRGVKAVLLRLLG